MKKNRIFSIIATFLLPLCVFISASAAEEYDTLIYLTNDADIAFTCLYTYDGTARSETVKYIVNVPPQTTVSQLTDDLTSELPLSFTSVSGTTLNGEDFVGTGTAVTNGKDTAYVIVYGDCNGNGTVTVTDYLKIKQHCSGVSALEGAALIAADTDGTNTADIQDMVRLKAIFKGVITRSEGAEKLTVKMIDVGQADSFLIITPENDTLLVDTGRNATASKNAIDAELAEREIDVMILTHPDSDHIGYAQSILENYSVGFVYRPDYVHTSALYKNLESALEAGSVPYRAPEVTYTENGVIAETFSIGKTEITFLSPGCSATGYTSSGNTNENSIAFRMTYGERSFLFTGDICECNEEDMLGASYITADGRSIPSPLDCDFLKVAHHGAETATSQSFLDAATPQYALISAGENKTYNHPRQVTLDKLDAMGIVYYVSRYDGADTVESNGVHIYIYPTFLRK